ncbi:hypothetical protein ABTJ87_19780, partial [Acinetobacter baumannii]
DRVSAVAKILGQHQVAKQLADLNKLLVGSDGKGLASPTSTPPNKHNDFLNVVDASAGQKPADWHRELQANLRDAINSKRLTESDLEVISSA